MTLTEHSLYSYVIVVWLAVAAVTFVALRFFVAPYGRHARAGWGPTIHRTAGWILMECPAVIVVVWLYLVSDRRRNAPAVVFLFLWLLHYVNRAFVYPWRLRGGQLRMPLLIAGMGLLFNIVNGWLQGRSLFALGTARDSSWFFDPRFLAGVILFLGGFALNQHSDAILRRLRAPGETGYKIPTGGAYRFVSCPNYFGELLEWLGWAVLTWSTAGVVFFLWTAANLIPRARSHHAWYRGRFPDYPAERRAVLPFIH